MIFDLRIYTCKPGTVKAQLELYEAQGLAIQRRHLGEPLLYGVTEVGPLNTFVHVWAYDDAADRSRRRQAMAEDPEWISYLKENAAAGYLLAQENRILTSAPFFDPKRRA